MFKIIVPNSNQICAEKVSIFYPSPSIQLWAIMEIAMRIPLALINLLINLSISLKLLNRFLYILYVLKAQNLLFQMVPKIYFKYFFYILSCWKRLCNFSLTSALTPCPGQVQRSTPLPAFAFANLQR